MANEVTLNATLQYADAMLSSDALQVSALSATVATTAFARIKQSIGFASAQAINLGGITPGGWVMLVNLDTTNFINVLTGSAGVIFAKLLPGEFCLFRMGSGVTAPYAQANTAACLMDALVASL